MWRLPARRATLSVLSWRPSTSLACSLVGWVAGGVASSASPPPRWPPNPASPAPPPLLPCPNRRAGSYAVNPASGERIPIWTADYVLGGYGSGAIMAVPGHDSRDLEFAQVGGVGCAPCLRDGLATGRGTAGKAAGLQGADRPTTRRARRALPQAFNLPVRQVVAADAAAAASSSGSEPLAEAFTAPGVAVNSASSSSGLDLNGLPTEEAKAAAIAWLEGSGLGHRQVNFKLRDWLFARQRYWGEPFPIVYPDGSEVRARGGSMPMFGGGWAARPLYMPAGSWGPPEALRSALHPPRPSRPLSAHPPLLQEPSPIAESELPLVLPDTDDFKPSGTPDPPLAKCTDWVAAADAQGRPGRRETSTMPQWAGSCWYYLRYIDPHNTSRCAACCCCCGAVAAGLAGAWRTPARGPASGGGWEAQRTPLPPLPCLLLIPICLPIPVPSMTQPGV